MSESIAEVAAIAAKLTSEQRLLLQSFELESGDDALLNMNTVNDEITLVELMNLGLAAHIRAVFVFGQLTPLGIAVRNHLISQGADHDR